MTGQGQEDIVECRSTQRDVVDVDIRLPEVADDLHEGLRPAGRGDGDLARVLVKHGPPDPVAVGSPTWMTKG